MIVLIVALALVIMLTVFMVGLVVSAGDGCRVGLHYWEHARWGRWCAECGATDRQPSRR